ncbi:LPXTG cell wall anchor domain-containing protein [Kitasatospora sp. NPDC004531]
MTTTACRCPIRPAVTAATSIAFLLTAVASPSARAATPDGEIVTVAYTGTEQTVVVPSDVCAVTVDAFGAAGGRAPLGVSHAADVTEGASGGMGGEVAAEIEVRAGQRLGVNVGGAGTTGVAGPFGNPGEFGKGGYNGGGEPGGRQDAGGYPGAGGGGATTVALDDAVVIIAGGGGGAGGTYDYDGDEVGRGGDGGQSGTNGADGAVAGYPDQYRVGRGGTSGGGGGAGGAAGVSTPDGTMPGAPGGDANGTEGGDGGRLDVGFSDVTGGGGGGGGAHGGGAGGGAGTYGFNGVGGGGGGGGSSTGPADAVFTTGARAGDGEVLLQWHTCSPSPSPSPSPSSETPTPTPAPGSTRPALPQTGDRTNTGLLTAGVAALLATGVALVSLARRGRRS